MFYIRIDEVSGFGIAVTAVQVVEPSFVIVIIASVAKWILESKRPLPCFGDPDEFRPEIIAIVYHNDSLSVNYSDDVILGYCGCSNNHFRCTENQITVRLRHRKNRNGPGSRFVS